MSLYIMFGLLAFAVTGAILFVSFYPTFGASQPDVKIEKFYQTGHYRDGVFVNQIPTSLDMSFSKSLSILKDFASGTPHSKPEKPLPVIPVDSLTIASKNDSLLRLTWFGHSAFLLEIAGKNILLDPMFGDVPAPHPWLGSKRFTEGLPIEIEKLPFIDAVLFSHDHYDHLDYGSILKLKDKVGHFFVPLGVGAHLLKWGVDSARISEHDWWSEASFDNLKFVCTPARHFSGRGILDRNATLWASWVIQSVDHTIYFSGDSGYGPHFKEIGEKYGPFDFAMMECGQYDLRWENIHMLPEQTAQAAVDLQAKRMMPIHWGAFILALHPWKDPVERVTKKAQELNMAITVPQIGEQINLDNPQVIKMEWWVSLK
ncbi:MAG: MBL fold metallo-hydrolase [Calditrichaeota bacterium]|nr:MBL fold metallo-hydrolase [Calditrichota bacterium]